MMEWHLSKKSIAVVEVGNRDVHLKVVQLDGLDHLLLSLGHDIPDVCGSLFVKGCGLVVKCDNGIHSSKKLFLEQVK